MKPNLFQILKRVRNQPFPSSYAELRTIIHAELILEMWELEQRATAMAAFVEHFHEAQDLQAIHALAVETKVAKHGDHLTEHMKELVHDWPQVASAPGEGYW